MKAMSEWRGVGFLLEHAEDDDCVGRDVDT
jgi:hypothetical protein